MTRLRAALARFDREWLAPEGYGSIRLLVVGIGVVGVLKLLGWWAGV